MTEEKYNHLKLGINFTDLVRTTLGPRGMNKMVVSPKNNEVILTNDGATIIKNVKGGNPIIDLFKNLAISQEEAIGDGTTTSTIISGQLLQNALILINKGIHPTTIINGYNLANIESMKYLESHMEKGDKEKVIKTAFGTKISPEIVDKLTDLLQSVKDFDKFKIFKNKFSNPLDSSIYEGYVFEGHTLNDRMKSETDGNIAILDFRVNLEMDKFNVTSTEEMKKMADYSKEYKRDIIDQLVKNKVKCIFYTDTTPEFESYLTEKGITGYVIYQREHLDNIANAIGAIVSSNMDQVENQMGKGKVTYEKPGVIKVEGDMQTLILNGPTEQTSSEIQRAVDDVMGLLHHELDSVVGAGAIEIDIALHLADFAQKVGGKEQLAIEKFAEAVESIPMIIAENAGLDAIEVLTNLKSLHKNGDLNQGVDVNLGVSDARERGIFEPVLVKIHAISSASNVANLILKLDAILTGDEE